MRKVRFYGGGGRGEQLRLEPESISSYELDRKQSLRSDDMCKFLKLVSVEETEQHGRYLLRERPHRHGYSWAEVVTLRGGVIVHGDCTTVVFRGLEHGAWPRAAIRWQARYNADYGAEKANIGDSRGQEWSHLVAARWVLEWRREKNITNEQAREVWRALDEHNQTEFLQACHDQDIDDVYDIGMVPAGSVYAAQAVLRRLVAELDARDMRAKARARFPPREERLDGTLHV